MAATPRKTRSRPVARLEYQAEAARLGSPSAEATFAAVRREEASHGFVPASDGLKDLVARVASMDKTFNPLRTPLDNVPRRLSALDQRFAELSAAVQTRIDHRGTPSGHASSAAVQAAHASAAVTPQPSGAGETPAPAASPAAVMPSSTPSASDLTR